MKFNKIYKKPDANGYASGFLYIVFGNSKKNLNVKYYASFHNN
ncbi:hypothetical protein [Terrisporobacter petrolearius]